MDAEIIRHCSPSLESFVGVDPYAKCIKETAPAFDESLNIKVFVALHCKHWLSYRLLFFTLNCKHHTDTL